jgi:lipopolysaccharide export LptBFGC system permease protein LptF
MSVRWLLCILAMSMLAPSLAVAKPLSADALLKEAEQNEPGTAGRALDQSPTVETISEYNKLRLEEEKSRRYIVLALLLASVASHLLVLWFICRNRNSSEATIVHGSGLVLVVYATVMIVIIARAGEQLTAAIGVLGAIAGYLFGSAARQREGKSGTGTSGESLLAKAQQS